MTGHRTELENPWWSLSPGMILRPPVRIARRSKEVFERSEDV
ncbi:hypothetical protein RvY_01884 [Ramazzottius varieornatus]|uniref:Uncharacterized protein n=1 Tax=Ramazzottius varieornatus TaxID=947166 RepID=A0A1D1UHX2_RAMVA|nr:hypothetical protein RvY_01884 [Ramazzottius varieornatus]